MTKEQETRIRVLGALAALFMVCATVAACVMPTDRLEKLGHWMTDPATATATVALGGGLLALYLRAKASPAAGLLLALVVAGTLQGCGAQLTATQRERLAVETQRCLMAERDIVDRPGTTRAQDEADLRVERLRCDTARAAIVGGE